MEDLQIQNSTEGGWLGRGEEGGYRIALKVVG